MQNQVYPERRKVPTQRIGTQAISGWPLRPLPNLITFVENLPQNEGSCGKFLQYHNNDFSRGLIRLSSPLRNQLTQLTY